MAEPVKTLALVYEEPPEQVFVNAAAAFGITAEQARKAYAQMICDAQPTIPPDGKEPAPLSLNKRGIQTMLALEGRSQSSPIDTRWFGIRHEQPDRGPKNGGFIRDRNY